MPHIGIERLRAGNREKHRAQHQKTVPGMPHEERQAVIGVYRQQDVRLPRDAPDAEHRQDCEPDHHDRPEQSADCRRAAALNDEQRGQQHQRDRNDVGLEERRRDLEPLDGAQHRDRRRDDAVAIEQRGADQARRHDPQVPPLVAVRGAQHQRGQRQKPTLAAVIGAHDDKDVFDRHDQRERPDDQGKRAQDRRLARIGKLDQRLADRIKRRGADIAIDDAERRQGQAVPQIGADRGARRQGGSLGHVFSVGNPLSG